MAEGAVLFQPLVMARGAGKGMELGLGVWGGVCDSETCPELV